MNIAAICIATYKRQEGLLRLLRSLQSQPCPEGWEIEIRVVNNDADAPSDWEAAVKAICPDARTYTERRRNIALARNTAVAMGWADAYLFIDDDEVASDRWVEAMLSRYDDADAVIGPVRGIPAEGTSAWLARCGAFDKPGPDHDGPLGWTGARTSSASVRGEVFRQYGLWFNADFGLTGGSDAEFFKRLTERGGTIVHERKGLVAEYIEPHRCTWKAVLSRRYKAGVNFGKMNKASLHKRWGRFLTRNAYAAAVILSGLPIAMIGNPGRSFRGLARFAVALGTWRAAKSDYNITRYPARTVSTATGSQSCALPC